MVEQTPFYTWRKSHEYVYITLRSEVVTQHGAKESQLRDLPPLAKRCYFFAFKRDFHSRVFGLLSLVSHCFNVLWLSSVQTTVI